MNNFNLRIGIGTDGEPVEDHLPKYFPERINKPDLTHIRNKFIFDDVNIFRSSIISNNSFIIKEWTDFFRKTIDSEDPLDSFDKLYTFYKKYSRSHYFTIPAQINHGVTWNPLIYVSNWIIRDVMCFYEDQDTMIDGKLNNILKFIPLPFDLLHDSNYIDIIPSLDYIYKIKPRSNPLTEKNPDLLWTEELKEQQRQEKEEFKRLDDLDKTNFKNLLISLKGKSVAIVRAIGKENDVYSALYSHTDGLFLQDVEDIENGVRLIFGDHGNIADPLDISTPPMPEIEEKETNKLVMKCNLDKEIMIRNDESYVESFKMKMNISKSMDANYE